MSNRVITVFVVIVVLASAIASSAGILSDSGAGSYDYETVRGTTVEIYGKGLYKDMSSDYAVQGIAQDYVTLLAGVPLLILGLILFSKGSARGMFLLAGTLFYFLLTYMFYTAMAMYNYMFPAYVLILSSSLISLLILLSRIFGEINELVFYHKAMKPAGIFLVINSASVALLWLGVIMPPLLDGSIYPAEVHHYTTLIVQGFDLGIFLPLGFVSGVMAIRKSRSGYVFATIYVIFLTLLMCALSSKILFMAIEGVNVIPVVFIMPTIFIVSLVFSSSVLKSMKKVERKGI